MIQSFRHKGLRRFYESGSVAGIQPKHAKRLRMLLLALDTSQTIGDMEIPGFNLHPLKGQGKGRWSVWVNGNCASLSSSEMGTPTYLIMRITTDGYA